MRVLSLPLTSASVVKDSHSNAIGKEVFESFGKIVSWRSLIEPVSGSAAVLFGWHGRGPIVAH